MGVGRGIGGEVQLQLGLESGVVVDGFDKSGEDVVGRDGVLEKGKFGNVDLIGGKVGGEVGWVYKPSFELGFEFEEVGCRGGSVLCSHSLHDNRDCYCCHSKHRIGDEGTICWPDGLEEHSREFCHSHLMRVKSFELSFVCGNEGIGGGTDGRYGHGPCWCSTDIAALDVGGVSRPLCLCEHVDEETIDAVSVTVGHGDEHGAFEPIWIGSRGVVIQSGSDGFCSSSSGSHFFRSDGGDVGVGFSLISSVNIETLI